MKNSEFYIKTLLDIGLSENEARVYFAALSTGKTTVLKIARGSGIKRTTVYHTIESLKRRGLVTVLTEGLKKYYAAEDPERLGQVLESRTRVFETIVPDLLALYQMNDIEGSIRQYDGLPAVKAIYEKILKEVHTGDDYCIISNLEHWHSLDSKFFMSFIERRVRLRPSIRLLTTDSPTAREHKKFERNYGQKIKILPLKTALSTNLIILPRKVIIHRLVEPISALVLTDPTIIQMHKEIFEIMWESTMDE